MSPAPVERDLCALLDDLLAVHADLASGVMPRAARITGTSPLLRQAVLRLDGAIDTTRKLLRQRQQPSARGSLPPERSATTAWSTEQECLAAVDAARSVT